MLCDMKLHARSPILHTDDTHIPTTIPRGHERDRDAGLHDAITGSWFNESKESRYAHFQARHSDRELAVVKRFRLAPFLRSRQDMSGSQRDPCTHADRRANSPDTSESLTELDTFVYFEDVTGPNAIGVSTLYSRTQAASHWHTYLRFG